MSDQLIRHDIDVGNLLYGTARFVTLRLSDGWDLAPGVGRPEIVAAHNRRNRKWIASGKAWYVIYHRDLGWAMELMLESTALKKIAPAPNSETMQIQGHAASLRRWNRKRGLFHPKIISFVEVRFNCEQTDRQIRFEISGRCPPEGFQEILRLLPEWWCH